jgi:hypothetical protein
MFDLFKLTSVRSRAAPHLVLSACTAARDEAVIATLLHLCDQGPKKVAVAASTLA